MVFFDGAFFSGQLDRQKKSPTNIRIVKQRLSTFAQFLIQPPPPSPARPPARRSRRRRTSGPSPSCRPSSSGCGSPPGCPTTAPSPKGTTGPGAACSLPPAPGSLGYEPAPRGQPYFFYTSKEMHILPCSFFLTTLRFFEFFVG